MISPEQKNLKNYPEKFLEYPSGIEGELLLGVPVSSGKKPVFYTLGKTPFFRPLWAPVRGSFPDILQIFTFFAQFLHPLKSTVLSGLK